MGPMFAGIIGRLERPHAPAFDGTQADGKAAARTFRALPARPEPGLCRRNSGADASHATSSRNGQRLGPPDSAAPEAETQTGARSGKSPEKVAGGWMDQGRMAVVSL